jgi:hypothetical protein
MLSQIQLTAYCTHILDDCEPNELRDASWAILATCCVARTNDLQSAKCSNFNIAVRHPTTGNCRVTFTHERHNCPVFDHTIICHIETELYVHVLKAYIKLFDDISGDPSFWWKFTDKSCGKYKRVPSSRLELSTIAHSVALKLGLRSHSTYKQTAFRQLGLRRLTGLQVPTSVLTRIVNSVSIDSATNNPVVRTSSRIANAQIVLLFKR